MFWNAFPLALIAWSQDPLTPELMEARARAKEWAHELDVPEGLGFDDKTMSTVRKYVVPPQAVHDVVVAFFLLLGEHEADTRVHLLNSNNFGFVLVHMLNKRIK